MNDEQHSVGAPTEEERARAIREQLKSLRAFDLAYEMMISLVSFGYQKMGLTDETSELRDLGDARLAIELLRANLEVVEREQGEDRTRDVRSTLAQMQLGYAQAVQLSGAAAPRAQAAEAVAEEPATRPQDTDATVAGKSSGEPEPAADEPDAGGPAASGPAADVATPRKPVAKKPTAKKPVTKKAAAKKPAARKSAPKKPAARKPRGGATPPGD
jgi:hypothetical protein